LENSEPAKTRSYSPFLGRVCPKNGVEPENRLQESKVSRVALVGYIMDSIRYLSIGIFMVLIVHTSAAKYEALEPFAAPIDASNNTSVCQKCYDRRMACLPCADGRHSCVDTSYKGVCCGCMYAQGWPARFFVWDKNFWFF
jgi:hypothetical protein